MIDGWRWKGKCGCVPFVTRHTITFYNASSIRIIIDNELLVTFASLSLLPWEFT